jgi:hypothetical protein
MAVPMSRSPNDQSSVWFIGRDFIAVQLLELSVIQRQPSQRLTVPPLYR